MTHKTSCVRLNSIVSISLAVTLRPYKWKGNVYTPFCSQTVSQRIFHADAPSLRSRSLSVTLVERGILSHISAQSQREKRTCGIAWCNSRTKTIKGTLSHANANVYTTTQNGAIWSIRSNIFQRLAGDIFGETKKKLKQLFMSTPTKYTPTIYIFGRKSYYTPPERFKMASIKVFVDWGKLDTRVKFPSVVTSNSILVINIMSQKKIRKTLNRTKIVGW